MSAAGILRDLIADRWAGLTAEHHTCWQFYAAANPRPDRRGRLTTLTGWQMYYSVNANLAVQQPPQWIDEPPDNHEPPPTLNITAAAWARTVRLANGTTALSGFAWLEIDTAIPDNTYAVVTQAYATQLKNPLVRSRIRHTNVLAAGTTGTVNLQTPTGYYAETAGNNKFARIKGLSARRRQDRPLGTVKIFMVIGDGQKRVTIPNPLVGYVSGVRRPLHYP